MIIEIDTMNMFHILVFAVNNHTVGLVGMISNIKQFAILGTAICKFSQTNNTGRTNTEVISIHQVVDCNLLRFTLKSSMYTLRR